MYLGSVKFYKHLIYTIIVIVLVLALVGLGFLISLIFPKGNAIKSAKLNDNITVVEGKDKADHQNQKPELEDKDAENKADKDDAEKIDDEKQDVGISSEEKSKKETEQNFEENKNKAEQKLDNKNSEEAALVDKFPDLYCESFEIIPTDKKTAYLTFDDGPSENTEKILDILKEHNIKATFFVITGEFNSRNLDLLTKISEAGHAVGIHSHTHEYKTIYASKEAFLEDLSSAMNIIYEKTGIKPSILRFPGGSINEYNENIYQDIIDELASRNFQYYDWNVSFDDAKKDTSVDEIVQSAMYGIELNKDKNIIMLAHDQSKNSDALEALEKVIDVLENYGYSFDKIDSSVESIAFSNKSGLENSSNK